MSPNTHRGITSEAARSCNAKVFALDYRLAPENPFPSAVVDALAAYLALVQPDAVVGSNCSLNTKVYSNNQVFLMGDSSGCSLILQLLQTLKALSLPMPAGACLMSPFVNNELSGKSWQRNWNSDFVSLGNFLLNLDMDGVHWAIQMYSNGLDPAHRSLSPICGDLSGLPPILIQAGDSEVVADDAILLFKVSSQAGNPVELQLFKHMFHCFQTFGFLPQAGIAFSRMGKFINNQLTQGCSSESGISLETVDGWSNNELSVLIDKHGVETRIKL
jgi:acetyl esterase/lipase